MARSYKISIIGAGNVAWHLATALEEAGHSIQEVYSKDIRNAEKLCSKLYDAFASKDLEFSGSAAEIFIIAVKDDAIESVISKIQLPEDAMVIHTSGSKSIEVFDGAFCHYGVLYPLQTFSKDRKIIFSQIPVCLEGSDGETLKTLTELSKSLTKHIHFYNSEQRKVIHIAAVFACNFTNHLLAIAKEVLEEEHIPYGIIRSLVSETINKALDGDPQNVQTGPAVRKDVKILQEHLHYLKDDSEKKQIYKILSESILKMVNQ